MDNNNNIVLLLINNEYSQNIHKYRACPTVDPSCPTAKHAPWRHGPREILPADAQLICPTDRDFTYVIMLTREVEAH